MIKKEREKINFINDYAGTETLLPGNANMGALLQPKTSAHWLMASWARPHVAQHSLSSQALRIFVATTRLT